jgi:hypothetical protein
MFTMQFKTCKIIYQWVSCEVKFPKYMKSKLQPFSTRNTLFTIIEF